MIILNQKLDIKSGNYISVIESLKSAGGQVRLVGGAVRDALLGKAQADIDIITDLLPEQVTEILVAKNIKVIPTGIKFGTVTAIVAGENFEITTLRKDIKSDGRHVEVEFTNDFYLDAERRDFTINALSYSPFEHKIYDYFTGLEDLKQKKVIFIGQPEKRIIEDYLRILRFFRFSTRFAGLFDAKALAACIAYKKSLHKLSTERIKAEMDLLLACELAPETLKTMFEQGILQEALPIYRFNYAEIKAATQFSESIGVKILPVVFYALLFNKPDLGITELLGLKLSRRESKAILLMNTLGKILVTQDWQNALKEIWLEHTDWEQYFIFAAGSNSKLSGDIRELYSKLSNMEKKPIPIGGKDLIKMGYSGYEVGQILDFIKKQSIKEDFLLSKQDLIKLIGKEKNEK